MLTEWRAFFLNIFVYTNRITVYCTDSTDSTIKSFFWFKTKLFHSVSIPNCSIRYSASNTYLYTCMPSTYFTYSSFHHSQMIGGFLAPNDEREDIYKFKMNITKSKQLAILNLIFARLHRYYTHIHQNALSSFHLLFFFFLHLYVLYTVFLLVKLAE